MTFQGCGILKEEMDTEGMLGRLAAVSKNPRERAGKRGSDTQQCGLSPALLYGVDPHRETFN